MKLFSGIFSKLEFYSTWEEWAQDFQSIMEDAQLDVTTEDVMDYTTDRNSPQTLETRLIEEAWIAPTLLNSWVDIGGAFATTGYRKSQNGDVHVRLLVDTGSSANAKYFVLPAGYRPGARRRFVGFENGVNTLFVDIFANGDVIAQNGTVTTGHMLEIVFRP